MYDTLYSQSLIVGLWHQDIFKMSCCYQRGEKSNRGPLIHDENNIDIRLVASLIHNMKQSFCIAASSLRKQAYSNILKILPPKKMKIFR